MIQEAKRIKKIVEFVNQLILRLKARVFGKTYAVIVINTDHPFHLHYWENWEILYPIIDAILKITEEEPFIRTYQSFATENRWLGFGRMQWNKDNNTKWTQKYRSDQYSHKKLIFHGTEIWAPDWNHCINKGKTPEIYISLYNYPNYKGYNEGLLFAIPKQSYLRNIEAIRLRIKSIHDLIPSSHVIMSTRYWGPSKGFVNRIEDMNPQELQLIQEKGNKL